MIFYRRLVLFKSNEIIKGLNLNNYEIFIFKKSDKSIDKFQSFIKTFINIKKNYFAICALKDMSY